ncbi:MAG: cytochrome c family protein [Rhizobiaceae bacterium]|nr:cytochrome c family protein [Rhizobiaceae bacterium]
MRMLSVALILAATSPALAEGDAAEGKAAFNRCRACHEATREQHKVGPHLVGVVGRTAGTVENYVYSEAMKSAGAGGLVWDEANIADYLRDPKGKVPGNKMAFAGIKDDAMIANIVAYLKADPKP